MHIRGSEKTSEVHAYNGGAAARLSLFVFAFSLSSRPRAGWATVKVAFLSCQQVHAEREK